MFKLLKVQAYRLTRNVWASAMIVGVIVLYVWMTVSPVASTSKADFLNKYGNLDSVAVSMAVLGEERPDLSIEEIYEVYRATNNFYILALSNSSAALTWISFILAAYFICRDFSDRAINNFISAGYSRISVFLTKVIQYYFFVFIVSGVSIAIILHIWCGNWISAYPQSYLRSTLGTWIMLTLASMSVPMLIAFICKGPIITAGVTFSISLLISYTFEPIKAHYPAVMMLNRDIWALDCESDELIRVVFISLIYIAASIIISYAVFRKRPLK